MIKISKSLYNHLYYISVVWILFKSIKPTRHYLEEHSKEVPWHKVIEIILTAKNPRLKNGKYEIEKNGYYVLFEVKNKILYIINAKKTK
jgi:IS5 family transposase